jgi:hypothetical protein
MKNKLKSLFPSTVPHSCFVIACVLLLALGATSWAAINSISNEAEAGMAVLGLPQPFAVGLTRHNGGIAHNHYVSHAKWARL